MIGQFMTASMIPFRFMVVAQILIYPPLPLVIVHAPSKTALYTSDTLQAAIYFTSGNSVSS